MTGGVVAAVQQYAADAGARMLRRGGNAADAAVAAALAQGVVDPYRCGIGGGGVALIQTAGTQEVSLLSFYGHAPAGSSATMFTPVGQWGSLFSVRDQANQFGYLASVVPGMIRGLADLWSGHGSGRISWREVCEPALELASDGFVTFPFFTRAFGPEHADHPFLGVTRRTCTFTADAAKIFAPDGAFPELGARFRQADYARTLERIAAQGPEEFYEGETARRIAADFAEHGGLIDERQLNTYRTMTTPVLRGSYRGLELLTEDAPSIGPTFLQLMRLLECWDLRSFGSNTTPYTMRFIRALNAVFQDRANFIGDPDVVEVPLPRLLSEDHARELAGSIEVSIQDPGVRLGDGRDTATTRITSGSSDTTHVTVVDDEGNAVLVTHSIGSGSGVVSPGLGFLHNNHMIQFNPLPGLPNSIVPGKRPNVGGAPVLVKRDGELVLALGSPAGGHKASAMAQMLVGIVDFGLDAQAAVELDRLHAEDQEGIVDLDIRFDPRTATDLAASGYRVAFTDYGARIAAVTREADGRLQGIADPRGDRGVAVVDSGGDGK